MFSYQQFIRRNHPRHGRGFLRRREAEARRRWTQRQRQSRRPRGLVEWAEQRDARTLADVDARDRGVRTAVDDALAGWEQNDREARVRLRAEHDPDAVAAFAAGTEALLTHTTAFSVAVE